ncbi:MAG TPA: hypothetical protein VM261_21690 [Kofleriaceae bacterium]|nr:hypothetical protein [Kofleriaceae bacterium]
MLISDRAILVEAAVAALITAVGVAVAAPGGDVWLPTIALHPAWLPVIILSARYGTRGLFVSLALVLGALALTGLVNGSGIAGITMRSRFTADLLALGTATLVAWIAMAREARMRRVIDQLHEATGAHRQAEEAVTALHESLAYLRSRHDRLDVSLSVWRDLAGRMERGDPMEAARAALELCQIRVGATAGSVQLRDGNRLRLVASRGSLPDSEMLRDIGGDHTVRDAIVARAVAPAASGAGETDSDVAAPIVDDDTGLVVGVIALRGVPATSLRAANLIDLRLIAQWLAPALNRVWRESMRPALALGSLP